MKACASCGRLYPEDAGFCPVDGTGLIRASRAPVVPANDARVGQALAGRYQVRRVIADGGMGRVYEALDLADSRSVAIKVLHAAVAADPVQIERFEREFSLSGLLVHPGIVRVLDFIELGRGERALVMELLYGEELKNTLAREGSLPPARVVRMVSQVAQALDVAHRQQLVHRDLKPDNVFLCQTPEGDTVKILDFGSVKDTARNARQLTALGTTIGSPSYMSPEQAQGATSLDHRADVWSLAVITFEALTGKLPFAGELPAQILLAIISKRPAVASVVSAATGHPLPTSLDRVLDQAFRKAPGSRFGSAGAFADALGAAFGLAGTHRDWATWPERRLTAEIAAALPGLLAAGPAQAPSAADDFFGESGTLEERPVAPPPLSLPPRYDRPDDGSTAPLLVDMAPRSYARPLPFLPTEPTEGAPPSPTKVVLIGLVVVLFLGALIWALR